MKPQLKAIEYHPIGQSTVNINIAESFIELHKLLERIKQRTDKMIYWAKLQLALKRGELHPDYIEELFENKNDVTAELHSAEHSEQPSDHNAGAN